MSAGQATQHCLKPPEAYCHRSWQPQHLREAVVVRRLNRFVLQVQMDNELVSVYLPNSGRLEQLLFAGNDVLVVRRSSPQRKTDFDAVMASLPGRTGWACIDSRLPAQVLGEALQRRVFPEFADLSCVRSEVKAGDSRLDFRLSSSDGEQVCWVEVKSVTLSVGSEARFPDAPTQRGRRHVKELSKLVSGAVRCAVVFAVCRPEASIFAPNQQVDSEFSQALWEAASRGVEVYSYRFMSEPDTGTRIAGRLPVIMSNW